MPAQSSLYWQQHPNLLGHGREHCLSNTEHGASPEQTLRNNLQPSLASTLISLLWLAATAASLYLQGASLAPCIMCYHSIRV